MRPRDWPQTLWNVGNPNPPIFFSAPLLSAAAGLTTPAAAPECVSPIFFTSAWVRPRPRTLAASRENKRNASNALILAKQKNRRVKINSMQWAWEGSHYRRESGDLRSAKTCTLESACPLLSKLVISYCIPYQVSTRTRRDNPTIHQLHQLKKNAVQAVRVAGRGCCAGRCG